MIRHAKAPQRGDKEISKHIGERSPLEAALALMDEVAATSPDQGSLLTQMAMRTQQLTGASGVVIAMCDGADHVTCEATAGSAAAWLGRREAIKGTLTAMALANGKVVICDDTRADTRIDGERYRESGLRSVALVPVESRSTKVGILALTSPQPRAFGKQHRDMLEVLAHVLKWRLDVIESLERSEALLNENEIALATLRESENRFRSAFHHSGIGMALLAADGRWLKVNPALCNTLGYSRQELLALDHRSTTHMDDRDLEEPYLKRVLTGELSCYEIEKRYVHKDGAIIWGLLTTSVVRTADAQALYLIAQIQNITARKATEEALKRLAGRDELTGLCNRREMSRLLQEEAARAERHRRPMSLIMLDLDAFKGVNDTYGHQAGDACLRQSARVIQECVRSFDQVARYGGEEFAVILPETSGAAAMLVAERIRSRVEAEIYTLDDREGASVTLRLTVSCGIASVSGDQVISLEQMIRGADASLYVAKNTGRNRCVAAPSARTGSATGGERHADEQEFPALG